MNEKEKARLAEIIARVNDLFEGDITDGDWLVYVNDVLKGKLLESETLAQQAANNTKEQFSNSPDLTNAIMDAIIGAFEAHSTMSKQALDSEKVRTGLKDVLLGPAGLYEALRGKNSSGKETGGRSPDPLQGIPAAGNGGIPSKPLAKAHQKVPPGFPEKKILQPPGERLLNKYLILVRKTWSGRGESNARP